MQYISLIEVLAAAIVSLLAGFLWYSPVLFGRIWLREIQLIDGSVERRRRYGANLPTYVFYTLSFFGDLIIAATLLYFIGYSGLSGYKVSVVVFFGFMLPIIFGGSLHEGKSSTLFILTLGFRLVSLLLMVTVFTFF